MLVDTALDWLPLDTEDCPTLLSDVLDCPVVFVLDDADWVDDVLGP